MLSEAVNMSEEVKLSAVLKSIMTEQFINLG